MKKFLLLAIFLGIPISSTAATAIQLKDKPLSYLNQYMTNKMNVTGNNKPQLQELSRQTDVMNNTHVRFEQTYRGYHVWHSQAIMHMPANTSGNMMYVMRTNDNRAKMTGTVYEGIEKDIANVKDDRLDAKAQDKAKQVFRKYYISKFNLPSIVPTEAASKVIVYMDENQRAHYGFLTSFYFQDSKTGAHRPTAIIDVESLKPYKVWDSILRYERLPKPRAPGQAGGIGGNDNMGRVLYDNLEGHRASLNVSIYTAKMESKGKKLSVPVCFLTSPVAVVYDISYDRVAGTICPNIKSKNINWMASSRDLHWTEDSANGGYSPSLDAYYAATVVSDMYQEWYHIPVYQDKNGKAKRLVLRTHYGRDYANAFWDPQRGMMSFGDGDADVYPLTTIDITAHEISHAFTDQHARLDASEQQAAALHEAFSDMAGKAAEYYVNPGKTNWTVGKEIFKNKKEVIRYMDHPDKDGVSIAHFKKFKDEPNNPFHDPHADAGIFNRAFFLLATSNGWNVRKAFDVMVQANQNYWTPDVKFQEAACGVVSAATDLKYDVASVQLAFRKVGLDTKSC